MPRADVRRFVPTSLALLLALATAGAGAGELPATGARRPSYDPGAAAAWREELRAQVDPAAVRRLLGLESEGRVAVVVELDVATSQEGLRKALTAVPFPVEVTGRVQRVLNAVTARVDARDLDVLRHLPGVAAVHRLPELRLSTDSSVPFVGAPAMWEGLGAAGEGIRIGIVDSGIDYLHPHFGGSGDAADYAAREADPSPFYPNARVVGGWDFFDHDADPFDCDGHGSHVAGIAGGSGVTRGGTTYTGPFDGAIPFDTFAVGPGVAPRADLYALRVGGCEGEIDPVAVLEALDWAMDPDGDGDFADHLDVLNLSLGAPFGRPGDVLSRAVDALAAAGVAVVAASGNTSDVHFSVDTPSTAKGAVSVAASVDDGLPGATLTVLAPAAVAGDVEGRPATFGGDLGTPITADLATSLEPANDACEPLTNAAEVAGKIALVDRGGCGFTIKAKNVQDAGGLAAVVVNLTSNDLVNVGAADGDPLVDEVTIPVVIIGLVDGLLLRSAPDPRLTLSSGKLPALADTITSSTSRGPAVGGLLKPDVAAPGRSILSAVPPGSHFDNPATGTSMAAPHVAGLLALLGQLHSDWTLQEKKALLMNTATNVTQGQRGSGEVYGPPRVGAGRVRADVALATHAVAYASTDPGAVSLVFETVEVRGQVSETRGVRVVNHGVRDVVWTASYTPVIDARGVEVTPLGDAFTVPSGGSAELAVTLFADSSQMLHQLDPTSAPDQLGSFRFWVAEESGYLELSGDDGSHLRLPVYAAPRPASRVLSSRRFLFAPHREILLTGDDVDTTGLAASPVGVASIVTGFELKHMSPDDPGTEGALGAADLAYVGVTADTTARIARGADLFAGNVYFGLATHGNWSTPQEVSFEVEIDVDRDRQADFILSMSDIGTLTGRPTTDVFSAFLFDKRTGEVFLSEAPNGLAPFTLDSVIYNTNVVVLSAPMSLLAEHLDVHEDGLRAPPWKDHEDPEGEDDHHDDEPGAHDHDGLEFTFDFFVRLRSRELGVFTDVTPWLTYSPTNPGIDFNDTANQTGFCPCSGPPYWFAFEGAPLPIKVFRSELRRQGTLGALLLHHHNDNVASRTQVVFHGRRLARGAVKEAGDETDAGWTYFLWESPEGSPPVTFKTSGGHGNPDLYVRWGAPPTQDSYDARSVHLGPDDEVTIESPRPGTYYVGLLAVEGFHDVTIGAE